MVLFIWNLDYPSFPRLFFVFSPHSFYFYYKHQTDAATCHPFVVVLTISFAWVVCIIKCF